MIKNYLNKNTHFYNEELEPYIFIFVLARKANPNCEKPLITYLYSESIIDKIEKIYTLDKN